LAKQSLFQTEERIGDGLYVFEIRRLSKRVDKIGSLAAFGLQQLATKRISLTAFPVAFRPL
jgi:hypothetical protein